MTCLSSWCVQFLPACIPALLLLFLCALPNPSPLSHPILAITTHPFRRAQTGGIFLIGVMTSGVVADYKEAEKLPGEIAGCLAGIEEMCVSIIPLKVKDNPRYTPAKIRAGVLSCTNAIFNWLGSHGSRRDDDAVFAAVGRLAAEFTSPMYDAGPPIAVRLVQEVARLRMLITRAAVISHSTYLPAGYALVELFVLVAFVIVILARYSSVAMSYTVIVGVTILYGGILRLLRDIENPFEYKQIAEDAVSHGQSGSSEIDLSCLLDFRRTLGARLAADPGAQVLLRNPSTRVLAASVLAESAI